jgi:hypothetical protein
LEWKAKITEFNLHDDNQGEEMNVQAHPAGHHSVVSPVEQVDMADTKFGVPLVG